MAKKEPPQEYIEVLEESSVVTMKSLMQFIFIPMKKTVGQGED